MNEIIKHCPFCGKRDYKHVHVVEGGKEYWVCSLCRRKYSYAGWYARETTLDEQTIKQMQMNCKIHSSDVGGD